MKIKLQHWKVFISLYIILTLVGLYYLNLNSSHILEASNSIKPVTLVTGLYETQRNLHPIQYYLDLLNDTLQIPLAFVVYTQTNFVEHVRELRGKHDPAMIVIPMEINQLQYYRDKARIDEILKSKKFQETIPLMDRIECMNSVNLIINYSKYGLMQWVSLFNPFDTLAFVWLDAGLTINSLADLNRGSRKSGHHRKLTIQTLDKLGKTSNFNETQSRGRIVGRMIKGSRWVIDKVANKLQQVWDDDFLANDLVNTDKNALLLLNERQPDLLDIRN